MSPTKINPRPNWAGGFPISLRISHHPYHLPPDELSSLHSRPHSYPGDSIKDPLRRHRAIFLRVRDEAGELRLPAELLAEYYAVNIVYLGKWWLQRPTEIPMPELKKYLRLLFANKDFLLPPGENGQTD